MTSYWYLSQIHLQTLEICPPLFQKYYIQQLKPLPNFFVEEKAQWGKLFHLKMQQYNAGLSLEQILTDNQEFNQSLRALISATEEVWISPDIINRQAEYKLNFILEQFIFTAVYDLIILYPKKAIIFDWKTSLKPEDNKLINHWQTKLYLYILAETLNYKPHQIEFTYWFVKLPDKPQSFTIKYNKPKHDRTKQELNYLLNKLENLTKEYTENNLDFPHHNNCNNCPHRHLFQEELQRFYIAENMPTSLDEI